MFLPLMVALVSAPGLRVFLVASSSFFTWAPASTMPLNKRALNKIRFILDGVPVLGEYTTARGAAPAGFLSETSSSALARNPERSRRGSRRNRVPLCREG